jgi:tetratricopeptide (TPR) repeat protein
MVLEAVGHANTNASNGNSGPPADTETAEQLFQQGYDLQVKNDNAGAIAKYRAAIAKQPQFPKAHRNLGAALVNSKQYQEGIKELEVALQQDPTPNDQVYYNLGLAYFKLENYEKAGEYFKQAAEYGTDADAYAYAGFALDNAGDEEGADEEYKKYLSKKPDGNYAPLIKGIMSGKSSVPTAEDVEF